jgi:hypothetical protein
MKDLDDRDGCKGQTGPCSALHRPVRMNYFHGQLISERDLKTEQAYLRAKLAHANRCLHGYGVLCGLLVEPIAPPEDCVPDDAARRKEIKRRLAALEAELARIKERIAATEDPEQRQELEQAAEARAAERAALREELNALDASRPDQAQDPCADPKQPIHRVRVTCGAAIDCDGKDVVLTHDRIVDVAALLKPAERDRLVEAGTLPVYLTICYEDCPSEPARPFALDDCATTAACQPTRIVEGARIAASLGAPDADRRCAPCCDCCAEPCLLLATLTVTDDEPIGADDIDYADRRRFGLYDATVIESISWRNGAIYSGKTANAILGTEDPAGGIEITFSREVRVATLVPGVIELMRVTGGGGLSGVTVAMEGAFVDLPKDGMVRTVRYRDMTGEKAQPNDRIMIMVRTPFILDRCCRPVEGLHVGGRVPLKAGSHAQAEKVTKEARAAAASEGLCPTPPWGPMPWTTSGGGNFESWFWVAGE